MAGRAIRLFGAFHCRSRRSWCATLAIQPEYLKTHGADGIINYSEWSVPLGRRFRALKLWFLIRSYGLEGLRERIRNHVAWSQDLAERLRSNEPGFEIVTEPVLSLFTFRLAGKSDSDNLATLTGSTPTGGSISPRHASTGASPFAFRSASSTQRETDVETAFDVMREMPAESQLMFATYVSNGIRYWGVADGGHDCPFTGFSSMANPAQCHRGGRPRGSCQRGIRPPRHPSSWQFHLRNPGARSREDHLCRRQFPDRNAEYKDGQEAPPNMSLFIRFPRSFVGHGVPLTRPPETPQLDYEGEIAIVIGKGGRRIPEADALSHIAGLTLCNEGTLRDWVRHAKFNVTQGKNWDGSGAMGPWLVPFTDPAQIIDIHLQTRVNGETRQDDRTGRMLFPVARQIAYISTFTTLVPGDIIVTGTPTGAGARSDPPVWLVPGDTIEIEADGIGTLRNGVVDE
jgi:2-keto-4-pentenoate hydratase/2-oxohepta-3-ene-1,7-dioic acid hydratase in catechol pathway